ncbi:uncharacterized protein LOC119085932 [Bradysia coprophila]|uniref:uncharacterized protein LOC119074778 n=1 Tax=Bradysia coprophila TaxID=38358 RepID=UPI00187D84AE|nr:uncharacterized protein LOC119074778 [Bradysia coprophila]XP_037038463.1 uncharacterized protein LOC119075994 [Bradysia coprophila]XP_037038464.1 uncharacterized protein LOC119075994 [Bradysia coprophila]XP_037042911.1 uncharacterized protein LOC119079226 [Bradysia coprophila]XP_037042912.1 uncharacterized protein LOC119079226 [Bradysia coprophila]XP_037043259.1 uncharacterized protein LOC119079450 [Bradysia coprophila]XP_037043260.1 uncharacterized protein LOC119079450 [Bradysia coprophil
MSKDVISPRSENRLLQSDNEDNELNTTIVFGPNRIYRTISESSLSGISANLNNLEVTNSSKRNHRSMVFSEDTTEKSSSSTPKKLKPSVTMPPLVSEVVKNDFHIVDIVSDDAAIEFFSETQGTSIYTAVLKEITRAKDISKINFEDSFLDRGKFRYICSNATTRDWLTSIIPGIIPWGNAKIKSINQGAPPTLFKYTMIVSMPSLEPPDIFTLMAAQNVNLDTSNWRCVFRSKVEKNKQTWIVNVDENSLPALKEVDFKPYAGSSRIKMFPKK